MSRKAVISLSMACLFASGVLQSGRLDQPAVKDAPQFMQDGRLRLPADYREWMYVSSGLGMSYSKNGPDREPAFDNVFVKRDSYRYFIQTGKWPDRTMFVLELRQSSNHGSILEDGRFQRDISSIEASVKDEARFPEKWAYFDFGATGKEAAPFPKDARCFSCHLRNGAVDNTFVQFYPTLLDVARKTAKLPQ
jgi:hypothetical protein